VFEMAAPIQSLAKCEVRSVIYLKAKGERPAEIHKLLLFMVTLYKQSRITRQTTEQQKQRDVFLSVSAD
jgi:hypothetical protein